MSLIFRSNRNKIKGNVLKLFKIVSSQEAESYDSNFVKELVNLCKRVWFNKVENCFNNIEINFNSKNWKTIETFFEFIINTKKPIKIVDLIISNNKSINKILYSNELLNQIKMNDYGLIELTICMDYEKIDNENLISFIKNIIVIFPIDYAYSFPINANQDIITEKIVKKSIFSSSISITQEDIIRKKKMLGIKGGYIPKLYPINILNRLQLKEVEQEKIYLNNVININDQLSLIVKD